MSLKARHDEEVARARSFLRVVTVSIAASCVVLLLISGDPLAKSIVLAGFVTTGLALGWMLARIRDPEAYTSRLVTTMACVGLLLTYPSLYYWGIYSPAAAIYTLCISFLGLSGSGRVAVAAYLICALAQAALAALLLTGVLVDRGLVPADILDWPEALTSQVLIQGLYLASFLIARASRRAADDAAAKLEHAVRDLARREALLAEARHELDQALRAGAPGPFTGQMLGDYRLGVLLGHGGMGEVYEASHTEADRPAAIKLLHRHVAADRDNVVRFLREAKIAASLESDHVVRVFDIGDVGDSTADAGRVLPYLAMERLHGRDLAQLLRERKRLPMTEVAELVRQIGEALAAAWEAGIVHRDIKPQNLFAAEQSGHPPLWKLLDFGISKLGTGTGTLTAGNVVGTPGYMAPEQARGEDVDHRSDLFSLAAVAYRSLTGQPAFSGRELAQVLYQVVYAMPEPPSVHVRVHGDVDLVLAIGLAKRAEDRFDSAQALADALTDAARGALSDELRLHARALVLAWPWGRGRG